MVFALVLVTGGIVGGLLLLGACYRAHRLASLIEFVEVILFAAGIPAAFHLVYCIYRPQSLAHVTHPNGQHFDLAENGLVMGIGEWHAIELLVGAVACLYASCVGLALILKKYGATPAGNGEGGNSPHG
jgi:hypothetical protein